MQATQASNKGLLEKVFKLSEHNTDVKTEIIAGITTFMTMAYILVVNVNILGEAGMDRNAVFAATAIAAFIGCAAMALLANYPIALAPGMGLNAFFAYTVVLGMGHTWQFALCAVLIEGIIFIILTATNVREKIIDCIPPVLKHAVTAGIGLFIAFIGLANAGLVVNGSTILALGDMRNPLVLLTIVGIIIASILIAKNVKGAFLIAMLAISAIGMTLGLVGDMRNPLVLLTIVGIIIASILIAKNVKGAFLIAMLAISAIGMTLGLVDLPQGIISTTVPSIKPLFLQAFSVPTNEIFSLKMFRSCRFTSRYNINNCTIYKATILTSFQRTN